MVEPVGGSARHGASIEVLLVEDSPGDARLLGEAFTETDGELTLTVVADGVEAVETLSRRRDGAPGSLPDIVLLDLNLPRMDGFEVLEAVRADSALSHLPILVLTSSRASEDIHGSYERLANAYLTKPVGPDEFVSLVRTIEAFWLECAVLPPAWA